MVIYGSNNSPKPSEINKVTTFVNENKSIDVTLKPINFIIPPLSENVPICTIEVKPNIYDSVIFNELLQPQKS